MPDGSANKRQPVPDRAVALAAEALAAWHGGPVSKTYASVPLSAALPVLREQMLDEVVEFVRSHRTSTGGPALDAMVYADAIEARFAVPAQDRGEPCPECDGDGLRWESKLTENYRKTGVRQTWPCPSCGDPSRRTTKEEL